MAGAIDGPAQALDGAGHDQLDPGVRDPAGREAASANSSQPAHEHAPAAQQIGGAATQEQEAGKGQRVGVDDPLEVLFGEVQAAP